MRLAETLIFYLIVGLGVAVALYVSDRQRPAGTRYFLVVTSLFFWPLYLPLLLTQRSDVVPSALPKGANPRDAMTAAIEQVEAELKTALSSLGGWAENVLQSERVRLDELRSALTAHAGRIREMDALLAQSRATGEALPLGQLDTTETEVNHCTDDADATGRVSESFDRFRQSQVARADNMVRLSAVRRQTHADLMATLAWIRELVSMIHLAKFTGAPASRAEELVAQIAAAVEGISSVEGGPLADEAPRPRTPRMVRTADALAFERTARLVS